MLDSLFEKQIQARCKRSTQYKPLTASKVAEHVSGAIKEYMGGPEQWILSNGTIVPFNGVVLIGLAQVSDSSWQPLLAYYESIQEAPLPPVLAPAPPLDVPGPTRCLPVCGCPFRPGVFGFLAAGVTGANSEKVHQQR